MCLVPFVQGPNAADWPSYRHDGNRSAVSAEAVSGKLNPQWVFESRHRPRTAWPMPGEETPRMHSDRAYNVVVSGRTLFFGNNVDNHVYALDTRTAEERWRFAAGGAVRFAPVAHDGKLYFGSDDGMVYCLSAADGALVWKYRPSPSGERVIGNSRIISAWPVRTGLLIENGIVYFASGIFPYEGLYIGAVDAGSGREIWLNDTSGDQAWGLSYGGMAPQGYIVASELSLFVPTGRGMPALFDKGTGKFNKFLNAGGKVGGAWAMMDEGALFAGNDNQGTDSKVAFDGKSGASRGDQFASFPSIDMVLTKDIAYIATQKGIYAIDRAGNAKATAGVPKLAKEEGDLVKSISTIRERHKAAVKANKAGELGKVTAELNKATARLAAIAKEKTTLNAGRVTWFVSREQLGPLAVSGELGTLALAGKTLFAGGNGYVLSVDAASGKLVSMYGLPDNALGLAVADRRLFVSTDSGAIHCLGEQAVQGSPRKVTEAASSVVLSQADTAAATEIRLRSGINVGWCLIYGARDGKLAQTLAAQTKLNIVIIEQDAARLEAIRRDLLLTGLYGSRVIAADWDAAELPDYFANLIVSERVLHGDDVQLPVGQLARVLRPAGGVLLLGSVANWPKENLENIVEGLKANVKSSHDVLLEDGWLKFTRGKLDGAGSWSGLYGNTANTSSTNDRLVKGPLGVLWFGEPGSEHMVERHSRSVSPLAVNGRLIVQGMEVVMAYDAYNGTFLWQRKIPGAVRVRVDVDGSNIVATDDSVFVAAHDRVLHLDAQTGRTLREFSVPRQAGGKALRWGNIGVDGDILFGTGAMPLAREYGYLWNALVKNGEWVSEADAPKDAIATLKTVKGIHPRPDARAYAYFKRRGLHWHAINPFPGWLPDHTPSAVTDKIMLSEKVFAYNISTGELLWQHDGSGIPNISLTIANSRVFFLKDDVKAEERKQARAAVQTEIDGGNYVPEREQKLAEKDRDVRRVVCLEAESGRELWSRPYDLTGCGGTKLGMAYQDGRLLFFGHYSNHDEGPFNKGNLNWRRITVLQSESGSLLWSKPLNYRRRPTIVGDTIYIEPRRCDLATGEIQKRTHPITGESVDWEFLRPGHSCGIVTATPHNLFFRSYSGAIVDTDRDTGLQLFGGVRPGCWNSMIPANGLLSMQESSAGCTCSYSLRTTVVLKNKPQKGLAEWSVFISQAATKPVKHLAINFGAPGDMRAKDGTVWFAYPRPKTSVGQGAFANYGVKFKLSEAGKPEVVQRDWRGKTIAGTDKPWLFTSALKGVTKLKVPLLEKDQTALYTVRLGFAVLAEAAGQVFDVKLQGRTVLESFDIAASAGALGQAVTREFEGISVTGDLDIELVPADKKAKLAPTLIHALEVNREQLRAAK